MSQLPDHLFVRSQPERFGVQLVDGELWMQGVPLRSIAQEVQTPTYVYNLEDIRSRYLRIAQALHGVDSLVAYAVKANSNLAILRTLAAMGCGADVVSGGEIQRALAAGIVADRIIFSGVAKRVDEIDFAITQEIRAINIESPEEFRVVEQRAASLGKQVRVQLRVNPDVDPVTHAYIATGLKESKFGVGIDEAQELLLAMSTSEHVVLTGIACHIGSQIVTVGPFRDCLERLRQLVWRLAAQGVVIRQVDVGGGLGIEYTSEDSELDVESWGDAICEFAKDLGVRIITEPGRYIVGNSGVLLAQVLGNKTNGGKPYVLVDTAMNDLARPALYNSYHVVSPLVVPDADAATQSNVDIVGPVCECGDFLAQDRMMPAVSRGDYLVIMSAGAYGMVMAGNYNTRGLPAEVVVDGDSWAVARPRQSVEQLLAAESMGEWHRA